LRSGATASIASAKGTCDLQDVEQRQIKLKTTYSGHPYDHYLRTAPVEERRYHILECSV